MKAVNHFSKRLDKIFKDGNPTKAQIIDAFHKSVTELYTERQIDDAYDKGFKDAMVKYRKD